MSARVKLQKVYPIAEPEPGDWILQYREQSDTAATALTIIDGKLYLAPVAGGGPVTVTWDEVTGKPTSFNPTSHASTHENGGSDEINVAGLNGLLADQQTPLAHETTHRSAGSDPLSVLNLAGFPGGTGTFLRADASFAAPPDTGITELTGDVTAGPGNGSQVATIPADTVDNTRLANMATQTFKGRNTAGTGDPEDLSVSTVQTMLSITTELQLVKMRITAAARM